MALLDLDVFNDWRSFVTCEEGKVSCKVASFVPFKLKLNSPLPPSLPPSAFILFFFGKEGLKIM